MKDNNCLQTKQREQPSDYYLLRILCLKVCQNTPKVVNTIYMYLIYGTKFDVKLKIKVETITK